ncbi:MAG: epoxyqueuosine reductase QueH [Oscillospiraceae bacterium]|nr:epoxyqueuosine reductase QueH [Oscillospiraceae bacterium]
MRINYRLQTDEITASISPENRPRLLLQACCGPCSSSVLEYLTVFFDLTLLFYNPNIFPAGEHEKRLATLEDIAAVYGGKIGVLRGVYEPEKFENIAAGFENEPEGGARCTRCFELRLEETARLARERGFDWFCTTLTVSPHKDAQRINEIGSRLAERYGVKWLPSDFKKRGGYARSIELSKKYGLYRQSYCGCRFSLEPEDDN